MSLDGKINFKPAEWQAAAIEKERHDAAQVAGKPHSRSHMLRVLLTESLVARGYTPTETPK